MLRANVGTFDGEDEGFVIIQHWPNSKDRGEKLKREKQEQ
jgi:hypothetical protein